MHRTIRAVVVAALALALAAGPAHAVPPPEFVSQAAAYTPLPASAITKGLRCPVALYDGGYDRICASIHVQEDAAGNRTIQACGKVASYDRLRHRVARPLALRVRLVGDATGLRTAPPLYSTSRTRCGPRRVVLATTAWARVVAFVYRGGHWREYLVASEPVRVG